MTAVRCPELSPLRRSKMDAHLREFYGEHLHVCPAILAYKLGTLEKIVINRLSALGLRRKRGAK